jgi:hypothetical protein
MSGMPKRTFRIPGKGEPLLDIVSYGHGGSRESGGSLTPEQMEQIRRIVQRVPEVMVKVLPRASNDLKAAGKHLDYISRHAKLELETDAGSGLKDGKALLEEWDLDIDDARRQAALTCTRGRNPPKLVHKLMFSMPPGTPPEKVLAAVRNFAREEFWGQHQYAFVLHTDEEHPHVHLVLKAVNVHGVRLNIKKATLRRWRSEFARNLRLLGVAANATERAVRGESQKSKKDGIYRSSLRGDSSHIRAQVESVASEMRLGKSSLEHGKGTVLKTRTEIEHGWESIATLLSNDGSDALARDVRRFLEQMPPPRTEREWVAAELLEVTRTPRIHDRQPRR